MAQTSTSPPHYIAFHMFDRLNSWSNAPARQHKKRCHVVLFRAEKLLLQMCSQTSSARTCSWQLIPYRSVRVSSNRPIFAKCSLCLIIAPFVIKNPFLPLALIPARHRKRPIHFAPSKCATNASLYNANPCLPSY